jgi:hypothetical protein
MQSSLPSWLFEHSGPMSLYACLDALMARVVPHALGRASVMYINTKVIACLDVYQAALIWWGVGRRNMHVCRLYTIQIYIKTCMSADCTISTVYFESSSGGLVIWIFALLWTLLKSVGTSDWLMDFSMLVAIGYYGMRWLLLSWDSVGKVGLMKWIRRFVRAFQL